MVCGLWCVNHCLLAVRSTLSGVLFFLLFLPMTYDYTIRGVQGEGMERDEGSVRGSIVSMISSLSSHSDHTNTPTYKVCMCVCVYVYVY
jgi:hypothetical protein